MVRARIRWLAKRTRHKLLRVLVVPVVAGAVAGMVALAVGPAAWLVWALFDGATFPLAQSVLVAVGATVAWAVLRGLPTDEVERELDEELAAVVRTRVRQRASRGALSLGRGAGLRGRLAVSPAGRARAGAPSGR